MDVTKLNAHLILSHPMILASRSPRRKELLSRLGLTFTIIPPHVMETNDATADPVQHVASLAALKAQDVAQGYPQYLILAADTVVAINRRLLGKPANEEEAQAMLRLLSGNTHEVYTGFTLSLRERGFQYTEVVTSRVAFRSMDAKEIAWYTATDEPYDKAGAYAVQGKGAAFISAIYGSHTNVMGLPLCEVVACLRREGFLTFLPLCR